MMNREMFGDKINNFLGINDITETVHSLHSVVVMRTEYIMDMPDMELNRTKLEQRLNEAENVIYIFYQKTSTFHVWQIIVKTAINIKTNNFQLHMIIQWFCARPSSQAALTLPFVGRYNNVGINSKHGLYHKLLDRYVTIHGTVL